MHLMLVQHIHNAVHSEDYINDLLAGSFRITYKSSGNGCVMRTAPVGCFIFWNLNSVIKNAINFGCATHYNDVCCDSTILCSTLIAENIQNYSDKEKSVEEKEKKMSNEKIDQPKLVKGRSFRYC